MLDALDERINALFLIRDELRRAQALNDDQRSRQLAVLGLSTSCQILEEIMQAPELEGVNGNPKIIEALAIMEGAGVPSDRYWEFFKFETDLLNRTKLSHVAVDELIASAEKALSGKSLLLEDWRSRLQPLKDEVCRQSRRADRQERWGHLLRASIEIAGGVLIVIVNLHPPFDVAAWIADYSKTAGLSLIVTAIRDYATR